MADLEARLRERSYPGRGILVGRSVKGDKAVIAYFIMGRSSNSRNRVFVTDGDGIRTQAFDPAQMEDPSLIIYAPVRVLGNKTIVTNGDQTDTIYDGLDHQLTFEQSLRTRQFEPDGPNYTPRISAVLHIEGGAYNYAMSILKTDQGDPETTLRYSFAYEAPKAGNGRFISTYENDGNPLPSFTGEPFPAILMRTSRPELTALRTASGRHSTKTIRFPCSHGSLIFRPERPRREL